MSDFTAYRMLRANWIHPPNVEAWLRTMAIGKTLNVCCGLSRVGDVRVDTDENTNRTEAGDLFDLRFEEASFDTVICDPPFAYYNTFKWCQNLASIATKRLILSIDRSMPFLKRAAWNPQPDLYAFVPEPFKSTYIRLFMVWNRNNELLGDISS